MGDPATATLGAPRCVPVHPARFEAALLVLGAVLAQRVVRGEPGLARASLHPRARAFAHVAPSAGDAFPRPSAREQPCSPQGSAHTGPCCPRQ